MCFSRFLNCANRTKSRIALNMDLLVTFIMSVRGQKGESQNGCFKKAKHAKFSEKRTFLTPNFPKKLIFLGPYQRVRNVCFSENLTCFVFLKHPFWDSPFCLITDDNILETLQSGVKKPRTGFFFVILRLVTNGSIRFMPLLSSCIPWKY